ncbi:MAG: DUF3168 domain-containing protein [Alphaproteobacteria bacterium]|nr:MAG: DUF3168 domain-containing protein [Alphaproteobacteria bacterium]
MSVVTSQPLQAAIYARLSQDAALAAIVGADIFDAPPAGPLPGIFVLIGEEVVRDVSDGSARASEHDLTISVQTDAAGFAAAKQAAAAIVDALDGAALTLSRGRLIDIRFHSARSLRDAGAGARRTEVRFRARVEDN